MLKRAISFKNSIIGKADNYCNDPCKILIWEFGHLFRMLPYFSSKYGTMLFQTITILRVTYKNGLKFKTSFFSAVGKQVYGLHFKILGLLLTVL